MALRPLCYHYNGLRLAGNLAKRKGVEVKVFCFGTEIGLCGSCMDARRITDAPSVWQR
jgi:sulfur relay (sulfurtransferase) complex TusBCD TusD component (DsrE family)